MSVEIVPGQFRGPASIVLRTLLRKLTEKGLLTTGDVHDLLEKAAAILRAPGGSVTPEFARLAAREDLMPIFFGDDDTSRCP